MSLYLFFVLIFGIIVHGCESNSPRNAQDIADLQEQVALLIRQVKETRAEMIAIQERNKELRRSVGALETEVSRLRAQPVSSVESSGSTPNRPAAPPSARSTPQKQRLTKKYPCRHVWKLLGQGASDAAVASALDIPIEAVQACDQLIGQGGR